MRQWPWSSYDQRDGKRRTAMLDLDIIVVFRASLDLSYGGWRASTKSMEKWQPIYTGAKATVAEYERFL
jgi:hypothetical protein